MSAVPLADLYERVKQSELGSRWWNDPLMQQDVWPLTALGFDEEKCRVHARRNVHFTRITLPWLNYLAKLTAKARVREKCSASRILTDTLCLAHLNEFLLAHGYSQPAGITDSLLKTFISGANKGNRHSTLVFAIRLWAEEGWLTLPFTPMRMRKPTPKVEIIPEEVLHQIYEHLDLFPAPLERLFRLQIALGCRINEMLLMPRHCLKQEGEHWFLLRWVAKRKQWRYFQVHPLVAELVQEQQRFLDEQFGKDSKFNRLFCKASTALRDGAEAGGRFQVEPVYEPSSLSFRVIHLWLKAFREVANLKDKHGKPFPLTSHMFRRTKASVMAHCEVGDEYIAAVLGHGSLDMLPHYRKRSLERLEKQAETKGYVDMYGRVTTYKPRKQRYEKLADLMKVTTPLGECHRPSMLGDCQYRYACLSCTHHRVTEADIPQLQADQRQMELDLERARVAQQERRVTEIQRLLELVNNRLRGLKELQKVREENQHESA
jgi:integrase